VSSFRCAMMILPSGFGNHEHYHRGEKIAIPKTGSYQRVHNRGSWRKSRFCNLKRDGFFSPTAYRIAQPCGFGAAPTAENRKTAWTDCGKP
ncbi:MAG: hypothetical protein J5449_08470, partial [Oscillospiraceae bacterium]|nr:hypothetical protein [Oscillospiraceae bacterium]